MTRDRGSNGTGDGHAHVEALKAAARGRWPEILYTLGGIDHALLDGKHHPCPKCGGTDRFRLIDEAEGACLCNQCLHDHNGDGISVLQWIRNMDFPTALAVLGRHLGIAPPDPPARPGRKRKAQPEPEAEPVDHALVVQPWNPTLAFAWARHKPGVTVEALEAAGAALGTYRGIHVVAVPILPPGQLGEPQALPRGWIIWNSTGAPFRRKDGSEPKMLVTKGSTRGWVGRDGAAHLAAAELVWKVEGPTDLLALWAAQPAETRTRHPVLTNAFGAGERPTPELLEPLRGKHVVLCHDPDSAGRAGARKWVAALLDVAASVRVLRLPVEGQDLRGYLSTGGTYAALLALVEATPPETLTALREIRNYEVEETVTPEGETRKVYHAVQIQQILDTIYRLTDGWPRRWGSDLFLDQAGEIRFLESVDCLFAYLHMETSSPGGAVAWRDRGVDADGASFVGKRELYAALKSYAQAYRDVVEIPYHPAPEGVYVTRRHERAPIEQAGLLEEFLRFFEPATTVDRALIFAFALSMFWGGPPGQRPLFVITGTEAVGGQAIGKTSLVERIADLSGGIVRVSIDEHNRRDSVADQILDSTSLHARCVLVDNLDGFTNSREFAELVTGQEIQGRPAFGKRRVRPNRYTWTATAVSPELSGDLASRAFLVSIVPYQDQGEHEPWLSRVQRFVQEHREQLIGEAISILQGPRFQIEAKHSRYPDWDYGVLACHPDVNDVLSSREMTSLSVDASVESLDLFLEAMEGMIPKSYSIAELAEVWEKATRQKTTTRFLGRELRRLLKQGRLPRTLYPQGSRKHGSRWVYSPSSEEVPIGESRDSPGE